MIDGNEGYTPFTFHGLRHTTDSILQHLGVRAHVIDAQMGWQSGARSKMHLHYATAFEEDLREAALLLTDALLGTASKKLGATVGATGLAARRSTATIPNHEACSEVFIQNEKSTRLRSKTGATPSSTERSDRRRANQSVLPEPRNHAPRYKTYRSRSWRNRDTARPILRSSNPASLSRK